MRMCCERHVLARVGLARRRYIGRILCYHTVGQEDWGTNDVTPSQLRRHIEMALNAGYRFVPASEIARTGGGPKDLAITFDDGMKSVATTAAPIMTEYNLPWTFFPVSDWTDAKVDWVTPMVMGWKDVEALLSFVMGKFGLGLDNVLRSYLIDAITNTTIEDAFIAHTNWDLKKGKPYVVACSEKLEKVFESNKIFKGITATAGGFYGPQGRVLRLNIQDEELNDKMDNFKIDETRITNFEMETSAIYGLGQLLGHQCLSLNAIIANRATKTFSKDPYKAVDELIAYSLDKLANS